MTVDHVCFAVLCVTGLLYLFFATCMIVGGLSSLDWEVKRASSEKAKGATVATAGVRIKKLSAVIVCAQYYDFLAHTLPTNKQLFDHILVVSPSKDLKTHKLCEYWNVQVVVSDRCYEGGATLNKGKMINEGLTALHTAGMDDSWVVHLDADIFLPPQYRIILNSLEMDPEGLYHVDRLMCDNVEAWTLFHEEPILQNEADVFVHLRPFPVGTRVAKSEHGGWLPLGYHQLWNQGNLKLKYPEEHDSLDRSDVIFAKQFSRLHRHMLPEIVAILLETKLPDHPDMGANWEGRKTPKFTASATGGKVGAREIIGWIMVGGNLLPIFRGDDGPSDPPNNPPAY